MENLTLPRNRAVLNLQVVQGDSQEVTLAFNDDGGEPLDLTGYTIKMQMKAYDHVNAQVYFEKSIGSGIAVDDNLVTISFGDELLTANLNQYYYDILFVKDSKKSRLVGGKVFILNSVTV